MRTRKMTAKDLIARFAETREGFPEFAEWLAGTKTYDHLPADYQDGSSDNKGFIYAAEGQSGYVIEDRSTWGDGSSGFYLLLVRDEYMGDEIDLLEVHLARFAWDEGDRISCDHADGWECPKCEGGAR